MPQKTNKKKRRTMEQILADEDKERKELEEAEEETEDSLPETVKETPKEEAFREACEQGLDEDRLPGPTVSTITPPNIEGPPVPEIVYYDYPTAMDRVRHGIKVCRSIWLPECCLIDEHRRMNGRNAVLPWNPGREDSKAKDWMDFAVRLQGVV